MARIEKAVFISYRRKDVYTALAVYENLKNQGYDIFFDYRSIASGDFEQVISSNIRARAHFLLILTPTALDRCNEPGDWLRREIELAMDEKRNIVPLFFRGFRFGASSRSGIFSWLQIILKLFGLGKPAVLTGNLANLTRYNGLNVHEDYFEEGMNRLRTEFLSKPLDTVLHPISNEVQKFVEEEKNAADEAIKQKEDKKEPIQPVDEETDKQAKLEELKSQAIRLELKGDFWEALQIYYKIRKLDPSFPRIDAKIREMERELQPKPKISTKIIEAEKQSADKRAPARVFPYSLVAGLAGGLLILALLIWGGISLWNNPPGVATKESVIMLPTETAEIESISTNTPSATKTSVPATSTPGIGSTMTGKDGMTLLYVPAGEFTMGSFTDVGVNECKKSVSPSDYDYCEQFHVWAKNEEPPHIVALDAFWIDRTEVTNAMYAKCVDAGMCVVPRSSSSRTRNKYFSLGGSEYDNYPVIYVSWRNALDYCSWAGRRLPTEAEWEKAARSMDERINPWGNEFPNKSLANTANYVGDTTEVGSYPLGASPYGALDMAGNVWEWVNDWYSEDYYSSSPPFNPLGPETGTRRVMRGGSWSNVPEYIRSAIRYTGYPPDTRNDIIGFRCAMDAE